VYCVCVCVCMYYMCVCVLECSIQLQVRCTICVIYVLSFFLQTSHQLLTTEGLNRTDLQGLVRCRQDGLVSQLKAQLSSRIDSLIQVCTWHISCIVCTHVCVCVCVCVRVHSLVSTCFCPVIFIKYYALHDIIMVI